MSIQIEDLAAVTESGCWEWKGSMRGDYGVVYIGSGSLCAHRFVYERLVGPIPEGLVLDHLCRNTICVNPGHLEPVTHAENTLRGTSPMALNALKQSCAQGHPYDEQNTTWYEGRRYCRTCIRERSRERRAKERAGLISVGICPRCKTANRAPGRSYCPTCHVAKNKEYTGG